MPGSDNLNTHLRELYKDRLAEQLKPLSFIPDRPATPVSRRTRLKNRVKSICAPVFRKLHGVIHDHFYEYLDYHDD